MKVDLNKYTKKLSDVKNGTLFMYNGVLTTNDNVFLKTEYVRDEYAHSYNSVDIVTGRLFYIDPESFVRELDARVVID